MQLVSGGCGRAFDGCGEVLEGVDGVLMDAVGF